MGRDDAAVGAELRGGAGCAVQRDLVPGRQPAGGELLHRCHRHIRRGQGVAGEEPVAAPRGQLPRGVAPHGVQPAGLGLRRQERGRVPRRRHRDPVPRPPKGRQWFGVVSARKLHSGHHVRERRGVRVGRQQLGAASAAPAEGPQGSGVQCGVEPDPEERAAQRQRRRLCPRLAPGRQQRGHGAEGAHQQRARPTVAQRDAARCHHRQLGLHDPAVGHAERAVLGGCA
mmetsp:Transcript_14277/g.36964  ORF Transcript_14277/g.36964 Transcript_14277/m.36964 type:complete len:228 (+) Transcript_14277:1236-1919(+)